MSLITVENIKKEYRNQIVLNGVSLSVSRGERLALIGPNGSGKTTLLRIMIGLEIADEGNIIKNKQMKIGYLSQNFEDVNGETEKKTALHYEKVIKLEHQLRNMEKEMSSPGAVNNSDLMEKLLKKYDKLVAEYEGIDGYNIEAKIKAILLGLGLRKESLTIPLSCLSGGEKTRVAMVRILLEEPDLLILDEPTNNLDIAATEWLEGFLKKFDGGVLMVSHDRYFLDATATRTAELLNGTIVERSGGYTTFMEQKQIELEHLQQEKFRLRKQIEQGKQLTQRFMQMSRTNAAKSKIKAVEKLNQELAIKMREKAAVNHLYKTEKPVIRSDHAVHISTEIAKAEHFFKSFGETVLFNDASFLIQGGERVGIIGPNGCGKTTLINILLGYDKDFAGVARLGSWVKYGYIGQNVQFDNEGNTILEQVINTKDMPEKEARRYLADYQFYGDEVDKQLRVLSGGERVRLYLACIMLDHPHCLILDEPTNHLDVPAREALEKALSLFRGTVIAISHDRYFLTRCVDRILEISNKKITSYDGNYDFYRSVKNSEKEQADKTKKVPSSAAAKIKIEKNSDESGIEMEKIESEIIRLEEELKQMESTFCEDTPYQAYQEYEALLNRINQLYELWSGKEKQNG